MNPLSSIESHQCVILFGIHTPTNDFREIKSLMLL